MKAVVELPDEEIIATGRDKWLASKAFTSSNWNQPSYNPCNWLGASGPGMPVGEALEFPNRFGASYVWAQSAGKDDSIFLRFRVDGEKCKERQRDEHFLTSGRETQACLQTKIFYSADNEIGLWVNGINVGDTQGPGYVPNDDGLLEDRRCSFSEGKRLRRKLRIDRVFLGRRVALLFDGICGMEGSEG